MHYSYILHIDDDEDDQEIFTTAVKKISQRATCFSLNSGTEALEKLLTGTIVPDIIFLDLNMPLMNGQQFLTEIKKSEILKTIPVIILSTSSHPDTIAETKSLGAHDFITKPDRFDELVRLLKSFVK